MNPKSGCVVLLGLWISACGSDTTAVHVAPSASPTAGLDARVLRIADAIVQERFETFPEFTAMLRPPGARHDGLPDESAAAHAGREQRADGWLSELTSMDR